MHHGIRSWQGVAPVLGARVYVDPAAVVIGQVALGDDASVWPAAVIRGDVNTVRIGVRSNVQDGSVLHVTHDGPYSPGGFGLVVGDEVTIGHRVVLHGCSVGNRCLIGMGAIVMDGAVIEDEVVVAGGALVTPGSRLRGRSLYLGSPARRARELTAAELGQFSYAAARYLALKDQYLAQR